MTGPARRLWVPEVIQSADTDCGPACMASFLAGFGVDVPYGRLRDDCCTDVDGTSIDDLEDVALRFGLDAYQTVVPAEHLRSSSAGILPAIVVLALPGGIAHFVVVWRRAGSWFQVMDPMIGRRWMHHRDLIGALYDHRTTIPAATWREWAGTEACVGPLGSRLDRLGVPRAIAARLVADALSDASWQGLATLDALIRVAESAAAHGGPSIGREVAGLVAGFAEEGLAAQRAWIPRRFFRATAASDDRDADLELRGAVLLTAAGRVDDPGPTGLARVWAALPTGTSADPGSAGLRAVGQHLRLDGDLHLSFLALVAGVVGATVAFEALLFEGVLKLGGLVHTSGQRMAAILVVAAFSATMLFVESQLAARVRALGRRLEARLRMGFLAKLARLPDSFFARRLTSDLTLRVHAVVQLRGTPVVAESVVRTLVALGVTTAGIAWIDPGCAPWAFGSMAASVVLPVLFQSRLGELQLAAATYQGGLSRYLLDALRGAFPLRSHVAQQALRAEHDRVLDRWAEARRDLLRSSVAIDAAIHVIGMAASALVVGAYLAHQGRASSVLLLVFWASQLPQLGRALARSAFEVPALRATAARIFEPIHAPDDVWSGSRALDDGDRGLRVAFRSVTLDHGNARLLADIDATVEPGAHCAVVGASGAGKSSLLGLLLGWHLPTAGRVEVDGADLVDLDREGFLDRVAWVDPQVQLWNRSLYDNLVYGAPADPALDEAIDAAGLRPVLDRLPDGLDTNLGDGGSALSEGEAQRVRLARAMLRRSARLVLLDEPFRGLDRETRAELMGRVRTWWPQATLLWVTHDVEETLDFDQVLILDRGRAVESGAPTWLSRQPDSLYTRMVASEREVRAFFDESPLWTRWVVEDGKLAERGARRGRRARDAG